MIKEDLEKEKLKIEINNLKRWWIQPVLSLVGLLIILATALFTNLSEFLKIKEMELKSLRLTVNLSELNKHIETEKNKNDSLIQLNEKIMRWLLLLTDSLKKEKQAKNKLLTEQILKLTQNKNQIDREKIENLLKENSLSPTVITLRPSNITKTSATINGTINPNSSTTSAWFEMNGNNIGNQNNLKGGFPILLTFPLDGLKPGTNYSYRISAININGPVLGQLITFTTLE